MFILANPTDDREQRHCYYTLDPNISSTDQRGDWFSAACICFPCNAMNGIINCPKV